MAKLTPESRSPVGHALPQSQRLSGKKLLNAGLQIRVGFGYHALLTEGLETPNQIAIWIFKTVKE
jgi:hypothetical protein